MARSREEQTVGKLVIATLALADVLFIFILLFCVKTETESRGEAEVFLYPLELSTNLREDSQCPENHHN